MPAKARGQWGMGSDAYGQLYFNANSNWFEVDWADLYDRQWPNKGSSVKPPINRDLEFVQTLLLTVITFPGAS